MFSGSSWSQTTSAALGYRASTAVDLGVRPRVELLDPDDGDRLAGQGPAGPQAASARRSRASCATLPLASTTRWTARGSARTGSSSTSAKRPAARAVERRAGGDRPQHRLGRDQRSSGVPAAPSDLGAQQVEVLGGGRRHRHPEVVPGAQRQEPLDPGRGVLGPLALVAVRQQQGEPGVLPPLVLGRDEEVVDDDLGAVHEVAELGLPGHEGVRATRPSSRTRSRRRRTPRAASRSTVNRPGGSRRCPRRASRWASGTYSAPVA